MVVMGLFRHKKYTSGVTGTSDAGALAQRSLDFIAEAVLMVDENGLIKFANPAAATMTGYNDPATIVGLDYQLVIRLETGQSVPVESTQSSLHIAIKLNQHLHTREYVLVSAQSERRMAIDLTCIPTGSEHSDRIITFRDITTELAEEHEQAEFISTASHEMRTPVASIEGYLGLALNPQTATIDERAKKYLEAAHTASQHLGRLFKDLLDVTKLDDKRARVHLVPLDAVESVKYIADEQAKAMEAKGIRFVFGNDANSIDKKRIEQKIYMAVDYDFLHEIVDNLVGNAIKYTPTGGQISVAVRGDGDKVLISVSDTGIGIPADDIAHIFQKFYRVDNSQTRQIGGTGLGLYLVKQRVEALGGRVWVKSEYGKGSTFYVSLPRISESEYERMSIAYNNEKMVQSFSAPKDDSPISIPLVTATNQTPNISVSTQGVPTTTTNPASSTQALSAPAPTQNTPVTTPAAPHVANTTPLVAPPAPTTPNIQVPPAAPLPSTNPVASKPTPTTAAQPVIPPSTNPPIITPTSAVTTSKPTISPPASTTSPNPFNNTNQP